MTITYCEPGSHTFHLGHVSSYLPKGLLVFEVLGGGELGCLFYVPSNWIVRREGGI